MVTSNTESALQKATQLLNQPHTEKPNCNQSPETKRQGQEFAEIMDTLKQQQGG